MNKKTETISNSGLTERQKTVHLRRLAEYRDLELRPSPRLHTLFIEMTEKCNEHCRHCGSWCGDYKEEHPTTTAG